MNPKKNSIATLSGSFISGLALLIATPLCLRIYGPVNSSLLLISWSFISFGSTFDFGVGKLILYLIPRVNNKYQKQRIYISAQVLAFKRSIFLLSLLVPILSLFIYIIPNTNNIFQSKLELLYFYLALSVSVIFSSFSFISRSSLESLNRFVTSNILRSLGLCSLFFISLIAAYLNIDINPLLLFITFVLISRIGFFLLTDFLVRRSFFPVQGFNFKSFYNFDYKYIYNSFLLRTISSNSIWLLIASFCAPLIINLDIVLVSFLSGAEQSSYYAAIQGFLLKILVIPGSLAASLLPYFSSIKVKENILRKAKLYAYRLVFLMSAVLLLLNIISRSLLPLYLDIKESSEIPYSWIYIVFSLISCGVFLNSVGLVYLTVLTSLGEFKFLAKLYSYELLCFVPTFAFCVKYFGVTGGAFIWLLRSLLDTYFLFKKATNSDIVNVNLN